MKINLRTKVTLLASAVLSLATIGGISASANASTLANRNNNVRPQISLITAKNKLNSIYSHVNGQQTNNDQVYNNQAQGIRPRARQYYYLNGKYNINSRINSGVPITSLAGTRQIAKEHLPFTRTGRKVVFANNNHYVPYDYLEEVNHQHDGWVNEHGVITPRSSNQANQPNRAQRRTAVRNVRHQLDTTVYYLNGTKNSILYSRPGLQMGTVPITSQNGSRRLADQRFGFNAITARRGDGNVYVLVREINAPHYLGWTNRKGILNYRNYNFKAVPVSKSAKARYLGLVNKNAKGFYYLNGDYEMTSNPSYMSNVKLITNRDGSKNLASQHAIFKRLESNSYRGKDYFLLTELKTPHFTGWVNRKGTQKFTKTRATHHNQKPIKAIRKAIRPQQSHKTRATRKHSLRDLELQLKALRAKQSNLYKRAYAKRNQRTMFNPSQTLARNYRRITGHQLEVTKARPHTNYNYLRGNHVIWEFPPELRAVSAKRSTVNKLARSYTPVKVIISKTFSHKKYDLINAKYGKQAVAGWIYDKDVYHVPLSHRAIRLANLSK